MTYLEQAEQVKREAHDALQTIYDALNPGQRIQIVKNKDVKALLERYEVEVNK